MAVRKMIPNHHNVNALLYRNESAVDDYMVHIYVI